MLRRTLPRRRSAFCMTQVLLGDSEKAWHPERSPARLLSGTKSVFDSAHRKRSLPARHAVWRALRLTFFVFFGEGINSQPQKVIAILSAVSAVRRTRSRRIEGCTRPVQHSLRPRSQRALPASPPCGLAGAQTDDDLFLRWVPRGSPVRADISEDSRRQSFHRAP
ncbi:MAG: hypothetical protein HW389_2850 [Bacteroidetes bacterium]|nr:hypothetical protein [Bacteroidota bacterium]